MSRDHEIEREERDIYLIIGVALVPVLIAALIHGGAFDAGTTISLLAVVIASIGLVSLWSRFRRRPRLPQATLHRPHSSAGDAPSRSR